MEIKVLGTGCAKCRATADLITQVAAEAGKPVEIVKVDIQPLNRVQLMQLVMKLKPMGKTLLAEKVDSREQMEQCLKLGFTLFQGYYFAKPTIIAGKKLDHSQLSLMKLMGLLLSDADTPALEAALKPRRKPRDVRDRAEVQGVGIEGVILG